MLLSHASAHDDDGLQVSVIPGAEMNFYLIRSDQRWECCTTIASTDVQTLQNAIVRDEQRVAMFSAYRFEGVTVNMRHVSISVVPTNWLSRDRPIYPTQSVLGNVLGSLWVP